MKQKLLYGLIAVLLTASALFALSFTNDKAPAEPKTVEIAEGVNATLSPELAEAAEDVAGGCACSGSNWGTVYDTLSTTEIDTLSVPITFASAYTGSIHLTSANISGTTAFKVYMDEANTLSGATGWFTVDSMTVTAAATEYLIKRDQIYGRKVRLRVKGATGVTKYWINGYFKYH